MFVMFTMSLWKPRWIFGMMLLMAVVSTYLVLETHVIDCGRLTITTEEATQGDAPEYQEYTYGSHDYENYTITAYYPSGQKRVIPFDLSMVVQTDRDKFNHLGKQEIKIVYQKGTATLKINVILPVTDNLHMIVFETLGGLKLDHIQDIPDASVLQLPVPLRPGYAFLGWYENAECAGNPLPMNLIVIKSMVLYAKWELLLT